MNVDLQQCVTPECGTQALPPVVAERWREGRCTLCQDPQEAAAVRGVLARARVEKARQDRERANGNG